MFWSSFRGHWKELAKTSSMVRMVIFSATCWATLTGNIVQGFEHQSILTLCLSYSPFPRNIGPLSYPKYHPVSRGSGSNLFKEGSASQPIRKGAGKPEISTCWSKTGLQSLTTHSILLPKKHQWQFTKATSKGKPLQNINENIKAQEWLWQEWKKEKGLMFSDVISGISP